jgi:hypothetical protein
MGLFFSSADEHNEKGLKAYGLAEFAKACGHFRKAIDKDGRNDMYWWNYANACAALGDSTAATAAWKPAHVSAVPTPDRRRRH